MRYAIAFKESVAHDRVAAVVACVGSYGTVTMRRADLEIELEIAGLWRLPELGKRLQAWERDGLLSWRGLQ